MKSTYFGSNMRRWAIEAHWFSPIVTMLVVTAIAAPLVLAGCKEDEVVLETDRVRKLLTANTWTMQSMTVDGIDKTASYAGLTLKFDNTHFTTTQGSPVWPASGLWTFAEDSGTIIVRDDDVEMTIQEINTDKLVLAFTWTETTLGPGRLSSTSGEHVFTFVK